MTYKPRNFQMITIQMVQYALEHGGSSSSQDTTIHPDSAPSAFMKLNQTSYPDSLTCCQASVLTANCIKLSNAFRKPFFFLRKFSKYHNAYNVLTAKSHPVCV